MFALDTQAEHHLIVPSLLVWKLELLLFPPKRHFRKPNQSLEYLNFDDVIVAKLEPKRLAVEVLIMVRVAPTVVIHQIAPVAHIAVVIELEFVLFHHPFEHDSQQHPRPNVESRELHEYFALGFSYFCQTWPLHFLVACFNHPIRHSIQMLVGIGA